MKFRAEIIDRIRFQNQKAPRKRGEKYRAPRSLIIVRIIKNNGHNHNGGAVTYKSVWEIIDNPSLIKGLYKKGPIRLASLSDIAPYADNFLKYENIILLQEPLSKPKRNNPKTFIVSQQCKSCTSVDLNNFLSSKKISEAIIVFCRGEAFTPP